jgi:hypothetical protein
MAPEGCFEVDTGNHGNFSNVSVKRKAFAVADAPYALQPLIGRGVGVAGGEFGKLRFFCTDRVYCASRTSPKPHQNFWTPLRCRKRP